MKKIWKNHKIKIIALAYLFISAALIYFTVVFLMRRIIVKSDEIQALILDREIENSRIGAISRMEGDYIYSEENKKMLEVMLSREEGVDFIKKMENIAQETGNTISFSVDETGNKNAKPQVVAKKDAPKEKTIKEALAYGNYIAIKIDLKGDYAGFISFLNKLENTRNYVNIVSIGSKVEKESEDGSGNKNSSDIGVFTPTPAVSKDEKQGEKKEKNILHSVIDVVVYTKQ